MEKIQVYQVLHVLSVISLVALAFAAFAAPTPERRRILAMGSGVVALVVFVTGFGMIATTYGNHFAPWMYVKIGAWLGVAVLATVVFRRPRSAVLFGWITILLVAIALYAVYVLRLAA